MFYTHKKFKTGIKFNQNAWPKVFTDKNTDLNKNAKNDFEKDFFKLINNAVSRKNYGKCQKT